MASRTTLVQADRLVVPAHRPVANGEAVTLHEQNLADYVRILGPDHPDTLTIRSNLAIARRRLDDREL